MKIARNLIFRRHGAQFRQRFVFAFRLRQIQRTIETDVFRNGGIDQCIEIFEADFAQHLRDLRTRADMAIGESGEGTCGATKYPVPIFRPFCDRFFDRSVSPECIAKDYGAQWVLQVRQPYVERAVPFAPTARMAARRL